MRSKKTPLLTSTSHVESSWTTKPRRLQTKRFGERGSSLKAWVAQLTTHGLANAALSHSSLASSKSYSVVVTLYRCCSAANRIEILAVVRSSRPPQYLPLMLYCRPCSPQPPIGFTAVIGGGCFIVIIAALVNFAKSVTMLIHCLLHTLCVLLMTIILTTKSAIGHSHLLSSTFYC